MKGRLTKRLIDSLETNAGDRAYVWDNEIPGLGVVAYPGSKEAPRGRKAFVLRYGGRKTRRRITLGLYGPLTVEAARQMAIEKLACVIKGGDPLADKQRRQAIPLMREWITEYLERIALRKKRPSEDRNYLRKASAEFGEKRLDQVSVEDIEKPAARLAAEGHNAAANRFLASVSGCLQEAWRRSLIMENRARKVRRYPEPPPRKRALTEEELERVLIAIEQIPEPFVRTAFLMLVTTGARKSEVLRAKWDDINFERAIWTLPQTKAGKSQEVPLPAYTIGKLRQVPRRSLFVFPGQDPDRGRQDLKNHWNWIRTTAHIPNVNIHDLRRTFGRDITQQAGLLMAARVLRTDVRIAELHYSPMDIKERREAVERRTTEKIVPISKAG
ncbi:MAG: tyrosine-type recombinase/integrase [Acidobacteria bacterium]|nr:tyrosine-type recombinase/integrase [Acidobacteriota bacterium]